MRKVDLCLSSEGTEVILATSSDEKHPPENIIDGNPETFWTTTGMFPQEFIICFHKRVRIERLVIQSCFVRTLQIEKSTSKEPDSFEQWIERDLVHTEGQLQNEEIMDPLRIREAHIIIEHLENNKGVGRLNITHHFITLS
ncbi:PREDICTED: intraflagellar transport protein 25 homolog isoform X2 [Myotis davidii]|uniref:intraflagellar transport protein 25 homolog isoform X2 n=1 Tax=Myotis davidii TaxID=225400 RepID=UPI000767A05D|nr:PREDICTED: intraflagellar transport protein 25 homolog isoform X2 [Myotis davidii]XP_023608445.1 intraflagellar transport protein 25 homolog isoform X2 [Myotis lucifugus]XP_036203004.1 intraflagellar transport protein 25 homolog isoform X2 [Myotis myotis]